MREFSRRDLLAGCMAFAGTGLLPARLLAQGATIAPVPAEDIISGSGLSGDVAYAVIDVRSGMMVEGRNPQRQMSPASTAKTITTLYALEALGPDYRFSTRLIGTGPVSGGVLRGDLILAGGADPTLLTDDLGDMVATLAASGVRSIAGRFLVWGGAIPYAEEIAEDQPDHVGYNPAISGLNLNFNRVYVEWSKAKGGYAMRVGAPGARFTPDVSVIDAVAVSGQQALFDYDRAGGQEHWRISSQGLGNAGSRWLPVRDPAGYAGDVFRSLARARGISLPAPQRAAGIGGGTVLAQHSSDPLSDILHDMLKHSTNVTAEVVGMATSVARGLPASKGASGASMSRWLAQRIGGTDAHFIDHSGLNAETRIAPFDMARAIALLGQGEGLRPLLKPFPLRDSRGNWEKDPPFAIDSKTGTLNFVSTLTGYVTAPGGKDLVFAVFTANAQLHAQARGLEEAKGSAGWVQRSKMLQSRLLERWAALYS